MLTRRKMLATTAKLGAALALPAACRLAPVDDPGGVEVNDVQSQLNATRVNRIVTPSSTDDIGAALRAARREGRALSVAGGRHAMGGQQFGEGTILVDMTQFNRVVAFDRERGLVEVEAGIEWPELIEHLAREQADGATRWAIREKQTGVDRVSLGGSLAANIHGRGLLLRPIVDSVESIVVMDAAGRVRTCSRTEDAELFSLAIGGYGLFGVITHVTLRLVPRTKVQRVTEVIAVKDLMAGVEARISQGCVYGDCQYSTDLSGDAASHPGVFSCWRPVPLDTPIPETQIELSGKDWAELYVLARTDKKSAFERYAGYYLASSGQVYWSDTQQVAGTFDAYRKGVDLRRGTEMLTEVYVTKDRFAPFMARAREDFIKHGVDVTYGTIRFIERDADTFLPWATESCVCIVCNVHVTHTDEGIAKATADVRRIIDRVIEFGGRYFLTYHRWATRRQVETCYPRFADFLRLKRKYDPGELLQSNWYRHYREMFADVV